MALFALFLVYLHIFYDKSFSVRNGGFAALLFSPPPESKDVTRPFFSQPGPCRFSPCLVLHAVFSVFNLTFLFYFDFLFTTDAYECP